ncbi:MAG: UvrD-helicase domain-containing protein [Clostridia bacterium]|nr:UvrD-helicase domain-containing protein [Clostridia bacterium]
MDNYDLNQLNSEQLRASQCLNGPVLVLAGAGSGKTRVLTHRIVNMVNSGINPRNILAITFTNKAANEMKERIGSICPLAYAMTICTIHSFCVRVLRQEAEVLGYTKDFSIYDEADSENLLKRIFNKLGVDDDRIKKRIASAISTAKTFNLTEDKMEQITNVDWSLLSQVYRMYCAQLRASNSMDFDDLLSNTLMLFRKHSDVLAKWQDRFQYISIDEFQDTNRVQYQIFKLLSSKYGNLFVVGDDDQSIYGWRGAEIENILNFEKDFPNTQVFTLEENYRSTDKILNVANEIISKNTQRHPKTLFTSKQGGVKVELYIGTDEMDEARYCVSQIASLCRFNGMRYRDFAILMRINSLSRLFEQECLKYNIPFRVYGGFKFFERKEIKDIIAYLKIINNSYDNEALLRIINVPRRGIGKTTCDKLADLSMDYGVSILQLLRDGLGLEVFNAGTRSKLNDFYSLYAQMCNYQLEMSLVDLVEKLLKVTRYKSMFDKSNEGEYEKLANIDQFVLSVEEFVKENGDQSSLGLYLQSVSLLGDDDNADNSDCITISTVHSAKGLEFTTVFVVGLDDGIFPISRASNDVKQSQEERRLAYVALTRAKQRLYLTRAQSRFVFGERSYCRPSAYYTEASQLLAPTPTVRYDADGVPDRVIQPKVVFTPTINSNISQFSVSDIVNHKAFGKGIIIDIKDNNATVVFDTVGKKELALKYAPLTILPK